MKRATAASASVRILSKVRRITIKINGELRSNKLLISHHGSVCLCKWTRKFIWIVLRKGTIGQFTKRALTRSSTCSFTLVRSLVLRSTFLDQVSVTMFLQYITATVTYCNHDWDTPHVNRDSGIGQLEAVRVDYRAYTLCFQLYAHVSRVTWPSLLCTQSPGTILRNFAELHTFRKDERVPTHGAYYIDYRTGANLMIWLASLRLWLLPANYHLTVTAK